MAFCVAACGVFMLQSCSDDETYDVMGSRENKVYINVQSWNPVNTPENSFLFHVTKTPVGSMISGADSVAVKFGVQCTKKASEDIKVTLKPDNSLVVDGYSVLPDGVTPEMDKTELTIPKGSTMSGDSITIYLNSSKLNLLPVGTYMVPVKVSSATNVGISSNLQSACLIVDAAYTNCVDQATSVSGTALGGRNSWTAALDVAPTYGSLSSMFDGSTWSYWYLSPASACELTVDMKSVHSAISGIRINTYGTYYSLKTVGVYSSKDGTTWETQGSASLATSSSSQYIQFYSTIDAQYLKLEITGWVSSRYLILTEFDVFTSNE